MSSTLRIIIKEYVKKNVDKSFRNDTEINLRENIEEQLISKIKSEIIAIEKDKLRDEIKTEVENNQIRSRIDGIKIILVETVVLGFLIGLLVNQTTEFILGIKSNNLNMIATHTGTWIFTLLCLITLIMIVMFSMQLKKIIK